MPAPVTRIDIFRKMCEAEKKKVGKMCKLLVAGLGKMCYATAIRTDRGIG